MSEEKEDYVYLPPEGGRPQRLFPLLSEGMSLRDYFAGQVLAGTCTGGMWKGDEIHSLALYAYTMADAMMKARKQ